MLCYKPRVTRRQFYGTMFCTANLDNNMTTVTALMGNLLVLGCSICPHSFFSWTLSDQHLSERLQSIALKRDFGSTTPPVILHSCSVLISDPGCGLQSLPIILPQLFVLIPWMHVFFFTVLLNMCSKSALNMPCTYFFFTGLLNMNA